MSRRRRGALDDLLVISSRMPPWISLAVAAASYVVLSQVAVIEIPSPSALDDMSAIIPRQYAKVFAQIGQYVLPIVFVVGALVSEMKRRRSRHLLTTFAAGGDRPESQWSPTWQEFELLVGELFAQRGYDVSETSAGADGGVDLVLRRGDERYLVQCKHWPERKVGVRVVRELKGVMAQAAAQGGAVVTSGSFTAEAAEFAEKAGVDLVDGDQLRVLAGRDARERSAMNAVSGAIGEAASTGHGAIRCPRCGSTMVRRTARRGQNAGKRFFGCSRYPSCKGTAPESAT